MPASAYADPGWMHEDPPEARPPVPPTQDELPCDDGVPIETQRHKWQMDLLIEAMDRWLSASTAVSDKGEKMRVYQDQMRVPEYYWFDPFNPEDRAGFVSE